VAKAKTAETKEKVYRVLIPCVNNETGKEYDFGARVTAADFSQAVIDNWLTIDPPVLEVIGAK
jgi:hypothetical protein